MKRLILLVGIFLASSAQAYPPEEILTRAAAGDLEEVSGPGAHANLNPFSDVKMGYQYRHYEVEDRDNRVDNGSEAFVQVSPKGWRETFAYKNYQGSLRKRAEVTNAYTRSARKKTAYLLLIDAARIKEQMSLARGWQDLLEKFRKLYAIGARNSQSDLKKILKASYEVESARGELIEIESAQAQMGRRLESLGLKLDALETENLISATEIEKRLASLKIPDQTLSTEDLRAQLEEKQASVKYQTAKRNHLIDDVKFVFGNFRDQARYKIEVTFNMPFLAADNLGERQNNINLAGNQVAMEREIQIESSRGPFLMNELKGKIALLREVEANDAGLHLDKSFSQDPDFSMEMRRLASQRKLRKSNLLAEIRTLYVQLLFESKLLAEAPAANQLSRSHARL